MNRTKYFLIPVFNEELNIPSLSNDIYSISDDDSFFVFSDDGSTDKTKELINKYFSNYKFIILGDGKNRGPGFAFNIGFDWIFNHSKSNEDVIISLESDCTSDLEILSTMLLLHNQGYKMVLASVYAQGGGFDQTSFFRKLLSSIANLFYRYILDIKVLTLSSFYRVYNIEHLRKVKSRYGVLINENGFICMLELLVKSLSIENSVIEVPMVLHSKKRIGKSKMQIFKTSFAYIKFLAQFKFKS